MTSETAYGERDSSLVYWQEHRNKLADLYKSERYFLEPSLRDASSVLDVGCAAGGAYQFCREANPTIEYTGIDICGNLIKVANKNYPDAKFLCYDGYTIPFKSESVDLAFSIGVLHHLPNWKSIIAQMVNISRKYTIFDLRLTKSHTLDDPDKYYQKIAFNEEWDGETKIAYIVINIDEMETYLRKLIKANYRCDVYGYMHNPTAFAVIPYDQVYMSSFCIEKNSSTPGLNFNLNQMV